MIDNLNQPGGDGSLKLQGKEPKLGDLKDAKPIKVKDEIAYYKKLKAKYKGYLVEGLDDFEKERIAEHIIGLYNKGYEKHQEYCDRWQEWDDVYRMRRKQVVGDDGDMPNYRTPLSTVAHEVIHDNIMNVFFTPKDIMRVIPTEPNDIAKIAKLTTFGNWSMKNEMNLFMQADRLFHHSNKCGECPYVVHWVKEWGIEIKRHTLYNPNDPTEPLYDPDTGSVMYEEEEVPKLLYNGPKLEVRNRKDYIQPYNSIMSEVPEWEMLINRYSFDDIWKDMMSGRMYDGCLAHIKDWGFEDEAMIEKEDETGDATKIGEWDKEFIEFYGRLRVNVIKENSYEGNRTNIEEIDELQDEFIAVVHKKSQTLCSLRKNRFPMKMRPIGVDYCLPDDTGLRKGIGVFEFMESLQHAYDALFNQFIFGTNNSNNPIIFFTPTGNMRNDPMKIRNGYMYPTADANSTKAVQLPPPDVTLQTAMQMINQWAQVLFGISDYTAGIESRIDPNSPAKKAEIVVQQGNVRLNMLIKRKLDTMKDIFKRWYLLYRDNMPPNKFMRVVGDDENNPWKFDSVRIEDFELNSLPDFELTGNILTSNKQLQANTALATYQVLIQNPFFAPTTTQGQQALHSLTKWLIDKLDDTGLSRFMPKMPGENISTPEEEDARFLQGDDGDPVEGEDHLDHIKKHMAFMQDSLVPDEIKPKIAAHVAKHVQMLRQQMTQQAVMAQIQAHLPPGAPGTGGQPVAPAGTMPGQPQGAMNGQAPIPGNTVGVLPKRSAVVGGLNGRVPNMS